MSEAHCNKLPQRKALGLVTHDNTGGPFVVECHGCGEVYPSFHCLGGEQIADTGDYEDARCPHCDQIDPEECENPALAWNTQQLKINELQHRLNAADQRIDELETALKFYAEREHYHFESGNWDTVSGEPLNILWCGDEPDFIEDGSVARAALSASTYPGKGDDWRMNPCKQGHRDVGAAGGVAHCYTCDEKITAATTEEAFEQWNASHQPAIEKPDSPFTEQFIEDHLGKRPQ